MKTHGLMYLDGKRRPEYNVWHNMKKRCTKPKYQAYKDYGGRGISVCDRWLNSFANFFEDMGERPTNKHSLDRENNDGNYEPSNCRWATKEEQNSNKRTIRLITHNGVTKTASDWAIEMGFKDGTGLYNRIKRMGLAKAMATPKKFSRLTNKLNKTLSGDKK
jgi:hypothetical protein